LIGHILNQETFITDIEVIEIEKLELRCRRTRKMRVSSGRAGGKLRDVLLEMEGHKQKQQRAAESKESVGERNRANEKH